MGFLALCRQFGLSAHTNVNRARVSSRFPSESGAGIVELVVVLPLALFLIGALVDFGIALHQTEKASDISRNAARTAAIISFEDDFYPPGDPRTPYRCPPQKATPLCSSPWEIGEKSNGGCENEQDSLTCLSFKEATASLASADMDLDDWKVSARVCDVQVPGDAQGSDRLFPSIQVDIRRSFDARTCLLCFGDYLKAAVSNGRSLFAVEGAC